MIGRASSSIHAIRHERGARFFRTDSSVIVTFRRARCLLPLALVMGCDSWSSPPWTQGFVVGRITDLASKPIPGAAVEIDMRPGDCSASPRQNTGARTASDGRYRAHFGDPSGRFEGCLDIRVVPPASSGLSMVTIQRPGTVIDSQSGDSAVVNVVLER